MYPRAVVAGAACTVCAHPRIEEIDADLLDPVMSGYSRIARVYSLRKDAVRRHKVNGHVGSPVPVVDLPDAPEQPEVIVLSAVDVLKATLQELGQVDTAGMSPRELNVHVDLKRKVAVDLAKYQVAVDREGPAQRELRALEEMVIAGDEALEKFPEARRAVAQAVAEWKARRAYAAEEAS